MPILLLGAAVAIASPACRASEAQSTTALTSQMLKRIAEAVDGNRTGARIYVVLGTDVRNEVLGVADNPKAAAELVSEAGEKAISTGPWQTERDLAMNVAACVHDGKQSRMQSDRCTGPVQSLRLDDIRAMTLGITRTNGAVDTLPIPPGSDAIFLTMPAVDKFAVPYYSKVIGLEGTTEMRQQFQQVYGGARR